MQTAQLRMGEQTRGNDAVGSISPFWGVPLESIKHGAVNRAERRAGYQPLGGSTAPHAAAAKRKRQAKKAARKKQRR